MGVIMNLPDLIEVRGIAQARAALLKERGIETILDLIEVDIAEVADIPGISRNMARDLRENARRCLRRWRGEQAKEGVTITDEDLKSVQSQAAETDTDEGAEAETVVVEAQPEHSKTDNTEEKPPKPEKSGKKSKKGGGSAKKKKADVADKKKKKDGKDKKKPEKGKSKGKASAKKKDDKKKKKKK